MNEPSERLLRPGHNFTNWGELKLARALTHMADLRSRVIEYNAGRNLLARGFQATPTRIEFRLVDVSSPPPVQEWSLVLGDAIHCFRAALDAVAWNLARLDDGDPGTNSRIYFPITSDPAKWHDWVKKRIPTVPVVFQDRLERLQAWHLSPDSALPFADLDRLDVDDKHKGLLRATVGSKGVDVVNEISVDVVPIPATWSITPWTPSGGAAVAEGSVVLAFDGDHPIRLGSDEPSFVTVAATLEEDGHTYDLADWGSSIGSFVRFALDVVYGGVDYALHRASGSPPFVPKSGEQAI